MNCFCSHSTALSEFNVDFETMSNNLITLPVFILEYKKDSRSAKKCTKITLEIPCCDVWDFCEGHYEGQVICGGSAVEITLPVVPAFWTMYFKRMNKNREKKGNTNEQDKYAPETLVTKLSCLRHWSQSCLNTLWSLQQWSSQSVFSCAKG